MDVGINLWIIGWGLVTSTQPYMNALHFKVCDTEERTHERYWHSKTLKWPHNGLDGVSNHQPHHCLLSRLFGRRSKKTSKLRVTGLCVGNSPGIGGFPTQIASNSEHVSIWWRHHEQGTNRSPILTIFCCSFQHHLNVLMNRTLFNILD